MTAEEFTARLDEWRRTARSLRDENEKQPEPLLTRRDLRKVNHLSLDDFAAVLDELKRRGE